MNNVLPFARGETRFGGDSTLISASVDKHLEGQEFTVIDNQLPPNALSNRVPTNEEIILVIKRAANVSPANGNLSPRRGVFMSATEGKIHTVRGHSGTAGMYALVVDDFYDGQTIKPGDLFYCVKKGRVECKSAFTAEAITAKDTMSFDARGQIKPFVTSTHHMAGQIDRGVSNAVTGVVVLFMAGVSQKVAT